MKRRVLIDMEEEEDYRGGEFGLINNPNNDASMKSEQGNNIKGNILQLRSTQGEMLEKALSMAIGYNKKSKQQEKDLQIRGVGQFHPVQAQLMKAALGSIVDANNNLKMWRSCCSSESPGKRAWFVTSSAEK
ncbi:tubulin beta-1 chain [Striga asiatica]|uniref:Tubulin beta-1 chain n=1 Tax=Striga asiatica TaxID=4170 RepID=A0A5A7PGK7_STRAF|nr:tubulin beta-1 chain [Striga asiatica]